MQIGIIRGGFFKRFCVRFGPNDCKTIDRHIVDRRNRKTTTTQTRIVRVRIHGAITTCDDETEYANRSNYHQNKTQH